MERLQVPTVAEELVRRIRHLILAGEFRPGQRLVEEGLAERFGVSRPPIREALRVLQRDGIVASEPRRGFVVIPITPDDVREIYDLRAGLELTAVRLGVPVRDPELLTGMRVAVERMRRPETRRDPDETLDAVLDFHLALVAIAGNRRLTDVYRSLRLQLQVCMAMNLAFRRELHGDPDDAVHRHEELLAAIESGDRELVVARLRDHGDRSFFDRLDELLAPA